MQTKIRQRGAPKKQVTASKLVNMRVTPEQHERWMRAASAAGLTLSAWLKQLADTQAPAQLAASSARQQSGPQGAHAKLPEQVPTDKNTPPFGAWDNIRFHGRLDYLPVVIDKQRQAWVLKRKGGTLGWLQAPVAEVTDRAKVMPSVSFFVYFRDRLREAYCHPSQLGD